MSWKNNDFMPWVDGMKDAAEARKKEEQNSTFKDPCKLPGCPFYPRDAQFHGYCGSKHAALCHNDESACCKKKVKGQDYCLECSKIFGTPLPFGTWFSGDSIRARDSIFPAPS